MIHYLLQIIGFQLLFLVAYELFLKKETFFTWNRVYLLITPILSLVLPFVQIRALQQSIPQTYKIALPEFLLDNTNQEVAIQGGVLPEVVVNGKASLDIIEIFLNVWYVGMAVSVLLFGFKLYKIWKLQRAGQITRIDGLRVVTIPNSTVAFSFFNTMFLGEDLTMKQRESIVLHEAIHIRERHSLDLLFFEIQRIIFWFNPLVYAFQNNMILLQEYMADARAVKQLDTKKYYQGLLSQVFQTENISFINTFFNHSFIKKRIIMLQKSKSKQLAKFKYVLLIPVVCSMLFYVACSQDVTSPEAAVNTTEYPNFSVLSSSIGDNEIVTISVRDISLLSPEELLFVKKAKFSKGHRDLKTTQEGASFQSFNNFDEVFFVENSDNFKSLANKYEIQIEASEDAITEKEEVEIVEDDKKNLLILLMEFPGKKVLSVGVQDKNLLSVDELSFIELAKTEEGFKNLKEGKRSFDEMSELFFVDYTDRLQEYMKSKKITFSELYSNKKNEKSINMDFDETPAVPFAVIEKVPTYPGCTGDNDVLRACLSDNITRQVNRNFNTTLGVELGLKGVNRIFVSFMINKSGEIVNIRSRAPHPDLEKEADRVIKTLPKMKPGEQNGEPVDVLYSLPITFKIEE